MTDTDFALQLGEKILSLQRENAALKSILKTMRQPDGSKVPWREMLASDMTLLESSAIAEDKCDLLRRAILTQSDHNSALGRLHQHFLAPPDQLA